MCIVDFLRNIKYGLQNLYKWRRLIWNDRDWDWAYLYQIMEFKLQQMAKLQRTYGICTNATETALELEEAAHLLRRMYRDEYDWFEYQYTGKEQGEDLKKFCKLFEDKSRSWWD
jgi:hypothetical protein